MSTKSHIEYTDEMVKSQVRDIIREIHKAQWRPDYVVGINRGGLVPALLISQYMDVPMESIKPMAESNLWMAEDAFGYPVYDAMGSGDGRKNILIVDDLNDTGATLDWIKKDWQSGCLPDDERWTEVWNQNVRFAVLVDNQNSEFKDIDYSSVEVNSAEEDYSIVFPWEKWW
jgi:xanthine phosphoribosyltransferase